MASLERAILAQIKTLLAGIDGTGSYTFDLSATDQVRIGSTFNPALVPSAYIIPVAATTSQIPGITPLNAYTRSLLVRIEAWCAGTDNDPGELLSLALDLQNDIRLALEADRTLSQSAVHDLEVNGEAWDGGEFGRAGLGLAIVEVLVKYQQVAAT